MKTILGFLGFMIVWCLGCAFAEYVLPDAIDKSWIMAVGYIVGSCGNAISDFIEKRIE